MPREGYDDKFLPFKIGDIIMVGPRSPERPNAHSRVDYDKVYIITSFYISIASLRCAYVETVDGTGKNIGVRLNRMTHTLRNPHWEI